MLLGVCLVAFGLGCEEKKQAPVAAQPPDVEVVQVIQQDVPVFAEWIGTTDGLVNAKIRAQVSGYLLKQDDKDSSINVLEHVYFMQEQFWGEWRNYCAKDCPDRRSVGKELHELA